MLGQRGAFGATLDKLAAGNDKIFALAADVQNSAGLGRFAKNYPGRFANVGIAEQNMVGIAAGLADAGYNVFAATFANFAALRANEFAKHFMGYMRSPVKLVGFGAGFGMGVLGYTHYGLEDVGALRPISNINIVSPADALETVKAVETISTLDEPVYLRLTGAANNPIVYKGDYEFRIGKAVKLQEGRNIALLAAGSMVHYALEAAKILETHDVSCSVINMHTIKPLDADAIDASLDAGLIVTVEEHRVAGGLGGAVAEYLARVKRKPPQRIIGIADGYPHAGGYSYMLDKAGLLPAQLAQSILEEYKQ
jgi:transketolase